MSRNFFLPGLTILAIWSVFWWPVVSGDAYLYIRDLSLFAAPMKHYMMARFASGELPMWTPYVSGGMPFLADPSNQVFYPPNVIFLFFTSTEHALSFSVALHNLLGMCAFTGLCRVLGVSRWIAVWSGITYGLTGYILSIGDNVNYLPAIAWVPFAIAAYQLGINKKHFRYSALTALCLSFVVLAGDPQNAVLLVVVLVLLSIVAIWAGAPKYDWRSTATYFPGAHLILTVALALLITAAQVLPTLDLISVSARHSTLPYDQIEMWSFPIARLLEYFQPYIFGSHYPTYDFLTPELYPSFSGPWAGSVYLGTIPVILTLVGVASLDKVRCVWLLVLIATLVLSLGANTPIHALVVEYVPLVGTQRYPEKFVFWVTVSACLLASFGAQTLLGHKRLLIFAAVRVTPFTKLALGIAVIGLLCWLSVYLPAKSWFWSFALLDLNLWKARIPFSLNHLNVLLIHTVLMLSVSLGWLLANPARRNRFLSVILVVAALDLFWVHYRSVPSVPASILHQAPEPLALQSMGPLTEGQSYRIFFDTKSPGDQITFRKHNPFDELITAGLPDGENPILRGYPHIYALLFRRDHLYPNSGVFYGVQYLNGPLSPVQPRANISYESYLRHRNPYKATAMANVRYIVTGIEPKNPVWNDGRFVNVESNFTRNLRVLENTEWLPRVLLVPNAIGANNKTQDIYAAFDSIIDPRSHVIITSTIPPGVDQPPVDVPLRVRRPSPERYEVNGSSPYQRAYLLLNESFLNQWRATVNGQAEKVLRANLRFMAIPIESGPFEVAFEYQSNRFLTGATLTGLGLLLCAGFFIYPVFNPRQPR